ncbi:MAG: GAF and ANTAR domain-containing protein [Aeromicrobium sp.]
MTDDDLWERFSDLARDMSESAGLADTLLVAVEGAKALVPSADAAGISMVHDMRRIETPAATDEACRRGDELQYELSQGPCLQSIHQQETVRSNDLRTEERWPLWSRRVADELGFRSMLCLQLFITHDTLGALNLYSGRPDAFDADDEATALALAAQVAVALSAAKEFESLESAIASRIVIGQAQGMLMQRYKLSPHQSFAVLARESQAGHRQLRQIAEDIVRNGIPETNG